MTGCRITYEPRLPSRKDVLSEHIRTMWLEDFKLEENIIRTCVNPKPWWLPKAAWYRLLALLIRREVQR